MDLAEAFSKAWASAGWKKEQTHRLCAFEVGSLPVACSTKLRQQIILAQVTAAIKLLLSTV